MKTIYRLEFNGKGVYRARCNSNYINEIIENYNLGNSTDRSPAPWQDKGMGAHTNKVGEPHFIFGFDSLTALTNWFCLECLEELMEIANVNLLILKVEPDQVFLGDKQCIFNKCAILEVETITGFNQLKSIL